MNYNPHFMKRMVGCDLLWLAVASCVLTLASPSTIQEGECLLTRDPRCSATFRECEQREGAEKVTWVGSRNKELGAKAQS